MLLAKIRWNGNGKLLLFSKESQQKILKDIGRDRYIKIPKENTNARGVEITAEALTLLEKCAHTQTKHSEPFAKYYHTNLRCLHINLNTLLRSTAES